MRSNYLSNSQAAEELLAEIQEFGGRAILAPADISDFPDTYRMAQQVLEEFGHLDILVNNAGVTSDKTFVNMDHATWRKVLSINLDGVFNCTKVFVDGMVEQNYGRVVNITSVIGQIGNFGQANYAASKARRGRHDQIVGQGTGRQRHQRQRGGARLHRDGDWSRPYRSGCRNGC